MLPVYVGALVVAALILVVQLAFGHHDTDAGGAGPSEHAAEGHGDGVTPLTFIASLRFWAFALLAFGIVGTMITLFALAETGFTAGIATLAGVASGVLAVVVIRSLARRTESSHGALGDVLGRVGRVVVPPSERGVCKVRVELKGSSIDYVARTRDALAEGEIVLVEEMDGDDIVVSRAPRELKP